MSKIQILTLAEVIACLGAIRNELDPDNTLHINPPFMVDAEIDGIRATLGITQISYTGTVGAIPGGAAKAKIEHTLTAITTELYHE